MSAITHGSQATILRWRLRWRSLRRLGTDATDYRDQELRDRGDELEWRQMVARNNLTKHRRIAAHVADRLRE